MTTAVLISGQMRTFAHVWPNNYWTVYRKLQNPEFFISVSDDKDADSAKLFYERFPENKVYIEKVKQPDIDDPPEEYKLRGGYQPSASSSGILKQIWHLYRVWAFYQKNAQINHKIFLRIRPDLYFHWFKMSYPPDEQECFTPWWSRWGGINDRVAIMGRKAAEAYFTTYSRLDKSFRAGAPLHPESLMAYSLEEFNCISRETLQTWFTAIRNDGRPNTPPDPQLIDIADFARSR